MLWYIIYTTQLMIADKRGIHNIFFQTSIFNKKMSQFYNLLKKYLIALLTYFYEIKSSLYFSK